MLTDQQKRIFIRDGFIFLQNAVPQPQIAAALSACDRHHAAGAFDFDASAWDPALRFHDAAQRDPAVAPLLSDAYFLRAAVESLFGPGNASFGTVAQIAFRPFDAGAHGRGLRLQSPPPRLNYHVDGGAGPYRRNATPFGALVGVCLSAGQDADENRGQLTVWPGSHFPLHDLVRERWKMGAIDQYNVFGGAKNKPDLGAPTRVLMRPGDAVVAHQRLGHSGGLNLSNVMRKNLYFRVSHRNHNSMIEDVLNGHVMTQFEGVHHLL